MNRKLIPGIVGIIACGAAVWALADWFSSGIDRELELRLAIERGDIETARANVDIEGEFIAFDGKPSAVKDSWPWFRGEFHDNISRSTVQLANKWPEGGPPVLWGVDLGEGYAGPAVRHGMVYLLDYDHETKSDALRCFSLDDGKEIWRRSYRVRIKRNHGMSRTVPAVGEKYAVTIGPKCHVMCVDALTGGFRWGIDLVEAFDTQVPLWYTGQCPLLDGDVFVVAPGGKVLMAGISCDKGEVLWETPNPDKWQMSHASIVPMELHGVRMYVYCAAGGLVGVSAGEKPGRLLWKTTEWTHSVMAPSALQVGEDRIFLTAGYGVGSMMLAVRKDEAGFSVEPLTRWDKKHFACEQHTPLYYREKLYTVMPNDAGALKRQVVCMDPAGRQLWTSGKNNRFGMGPFMIADGKILVMDDDGQLTMARADADSFDELARAQVLHGRESWGPLALVDGRLLVRDFTRMVCLDMRAVASGP